MIASATAQNANWNSHLASIAASENAIAPNASRAEP